MSAAAPVASAHRVSFPRLVRSEWIKLWSLRSTWWCIIIAIVVMELIALLLGAVLSPATDETGAVVAQDGSPLIAQAVVSAPITFAQLVMAVLGCLVITGEYGSGMIRTTMLAAPRRLGAVVAKAVVIGVVGLVVAAIGIGIALAIVVPLTSAKGVTVDFGELQLWRVLVGGVVYLAATTVLATAIGLVIRVSAGAIATAMGLLLVLPIIGNLISTLTQTAWLVNVVNFLPSNAGGALYAWRYAGAQSSIDGVFSLLWWQGGLVLAAWIAIVAVVGLVLVKRRDV